MTSAGSAASGGSLFRGGRKRSSGGGSSLNEQISGAAARDAIVKAEADRQRERRRALVNCNYEDRPELFDVGETSKEKKLRVLLSNSNPTQSALLKHLTDTINLKTNNGKRAKGMWTDSPEFNRTKY